VGDAWPWIWLVAAVALVLGEIAVAGAFVLLPFGIGAAVACLLAFADVDPVVQWGAFVGTSAACFVALWQLRHRLDRDDDAHDGIGSRRLIGQPAVVLEAVGAGPSGQGMVRVGREEWRAASVDGRAIAEGVHVKVVEVRGTRVIVWPLDGEIAR
jgi:membrane protein implicated in regulation of membrane protease activity